MERNSHPHRDHRFSVELFGLRRKRVFRCHCELRIPEYGSQARQGRNKPMVSIIETLCLFEMLTIIVLDSCYIDTVRYQRTQFPSAGNPIAGFKSEVNAGSKTVRGRSSLSCLQAIDVDYTLYPACFGLCL